MHYFTFLLHVREGLVVVCIWWKAQQQKLDCKQLQTPQCSIISISIYNRLYGGSRELGRLNGRTVMHSYGRAYVTSGQCLLLDLTKYPSSSCEQP
jgi:hypothetical protein